jgi:hypothetical protein
MPSASVTYARGAHQHRASGTAVAMSLCNQRTKLDATELAVFLFSTGTGGVSGELVK